VLQVRLLIDKSERRTTYPGRLCPKRPQATYNLHTRGLKILAKVDLRCLHAHHTWPPPFAHRRVRSSIGCRYSILDQGSHDAALPRHRIWRAQESGSFPATWPCTVPVDSRRSNRPLEVSNAPSTECLFWGEKFSLFRAACEALASYEFFLISPRHTFTSYGADGKAKICAGIYG
jgi:hypothetical protein